MMGTFTWWNEIQNLLRNKKLRNTQVKSWSRMLHVQCCILHLKLQWYRSDNCKLSFRVLLTTRTWCDVLEWSVETSVLVQKRENQNSLQNVITRTHSSRAEPRPHSFRRSTRAHARWSRPISPRDPNAKWNKKIYWVLRWWVRYPWCVST